MACKNSTLRVKVVLCVWKLHSACRNHPRAGRNHTLMRLENTLVRVEITLRVKITHFHTGIHTRT
jgi:hypothetical protein